MPKRQEQPVVIDSVTKMRNLVYDEINNINNGDFDPQRIKGITKSVNTAINTYRLQMIAMKEAGQAIDIQKLDGLLDS